MIDQMRKRLTINRHAQFSTMRKVRLAECAWPVFLCKEHFSRRPFGRSPVTDAASQRPHLPVTESPGMHLLQVLKQCLCLQAWLDSE